MKRYETIATNLAEQIRAGHLPVGVRLPSLRHLIAQYGVSQSTVFRAYYLLEQWGLVRAEERAGYFVTQGASVKETAVGLRKAFLPAADSNRQTTILRPGISTWSTSLPWHRHNRCVTSSRRSVRRTRFC